VHRWTIKKDKPEREGYGLCLSLCNIVTLLHGQAKFKTFLPKLPEYSVERERARAAIANAENVGRLDEFVKKQKSQFVEPKAPLKIFNLR
jgi:hypothetical protein